METMESDAAHVKRAYRTFRRLVIALTMAYLGAAIASHWLP